MLLTAIELQGGQANIEGTSVPIQPDPHTAVPSTHPFFQHQYLKGWFQIETFIFLFRSSHGNDNKEGLKFILKLSRDRF